eukprot:TRINITY_DN573_c0_g2_i1.p1 TRINITY_DN573_c0_g2~~TRINITY_DN573_c0_g2_i1.p1  ORF type:complete len:343 (+),score=101.10 TRINITY_DN573_c0_g2_i1:68-1030(+)
MADTHADDWHAADSYWCSGQPYRVGEKLGAGCFGTVHRGVDCETDAEVAIKIAVKPFERRMLQKEADVYELLHSGGRVPGIPVMHWCGELEGGHAIVMDLLGPCLRTLHKKQARAFSLKTTLMLADQMLTLLEAVHSRRVMHRDIKPANFLMGPDGRLHIVDFGVAKPYCDRRDQHIPYVEGKGATGTPQYCSVNAHSGAEQGRRDDLESVGYVLVHFVRGTLPWMSVPRGPQKEMVLRAGDVKRAASVETVCKHCPEEFRTYLNYVKSLGFEDKPDYQYLRQLFRDLFVREGYQMDFVYDWTEQQPVAQPSTGEEATLG